jgi:ATP-dependent DNA helicase RecG
MRPTLLNPLFAELSTLRGVGPKTLGLFERLLSHPQGRKAIVADLLFHLPHTLIDRRLRPTLADAPIGQVATLHVRVLEHRLPPAHKGGKKIPTRIIVEDDTETAELVFFLTHPGWLEKNLPIGAMRWISGTLDIRDGRKQMIHPDHVLDDEAFAALPDLEPVYGLTEGLYQRNVHKAVAQALDHLPIMPQWLDDALMEVRHWPSFNEAIAMMHHPHEPHDCASDGSARQRLAYDELLAHQLALVMIRAHMRRTNGRATQSEGTLARRLEAHLPFTLTQAQQQALYDIRADLGSDKRMLRLVQGDVGSGKTIVALLAMAHVVEAGRQAALMAPTEILARQHYERMLPLAEKAGMRLSLLTGRDKANERKATLQKLAAGEIDILIGTHALFQEQVAFHDLALAVVDEQHRFGVHQRLALGEKGAAVDILVMTATPIPRTLVLTYFGDMDVSVLREKPAGRQAIATRALPLERLDEIISAIGRALKTGARVYWVCPLVEENEKLDLAAAQERFETLQQFFGRDVGLVHGRMKGTDKDAAMQAFQDGTTKILVATTVIEVGVDVPQATVMVIEHAERFGLAQLHQLRGRVGRGSASSSCILLYKAPLGAIAKARLEIMRESEDGFRIAEEDLKLRGGGEILGTRQSGAPQFRIADMSIHADLLSMARDDAQLILARDPTLTSPRGLALRVLLYLFERDDAIKLLRAG